MEIKGKGHMPRMKRVLEGMNPCPSSPNTTRGDPVVAGRYMCPSVQSVASSWAHGKATSQN